MSLSRHVYQETRLIAKCSFVRCCAPYYTLHRHHRGRSSITLRNALHPEHENMNGSSTQAPEMAHAAGAGCCQA